MALVFSSQTEKYDFDAVREDISGIECWLLDMDGTVSLGEKMIPGAEKFFDRIGGRKFIFLTNNSSHGASHYIRRLKGMGIDAGRDGILISTDALAALLKGIMPGSIKAFCVGTKDFENELANAGIEPVAGQSEHPDVVLVGFDTSLTYSKLDIACDLIRRGVPWYAANPDKVCPLEDGRVLPDCGAIIAFLETCTGVAPVKVIGKPETAMVDMIIDKYGLDRRRTAMVGDRIYTDLAVAVSSGIRCIAVLTGEASADEIHASGIRPDYIFDDIGDIARFL